MILSRIFSEARMSISNKHNYNTFTKFPSASLLHCIENILNHSSGKFPDSLTIADMSFTKSTGLCTIFTHEYLDSNSVTISSKKYMIAIPLLGPFSTRRNFPRGTIFSCLLTPTLRQLVFKQKKMSLRAENSAWWKMAFSSSSCTSLWYNKSYP